MTQHAELISLLKYADYDNEYGTRALKHGVKRILAAMRAAMSDAGLQERGLFLLARAAEVNRHIGDAAAKEQACFLARDVMNMHAPRSKVQRAGVAALTHICTGRPWVQLEVLDSVPAPLLAAMERFAEEDVQFDALGALIFLMDGNFKAQELIADLPLVDDVLKKLKRNVGFCSVRLTAQYARVFRTLMENPYSRPRMVSMNVAHSMNKAIVEYAPKIHMPDGKEIGGTQARSFPYLPLLEHVCGSFGLLGVCPGGVAHMRAGGCVRSVGHNFVSLVRWAQTEQEKIGDEGIVKLPPPGLVGADAREACRQIFNAVAHLATGEGQAEMLALGVPQALLECVDLLEREGSLAEVSVELAAAGRALMLQAHPSPPLTEHRDERAFPAAQEAVQETAGPILVKALEDPACRPLLTFVDAVADPERPATQQRFGFHGVDVLLGHVRDFPCSESVNALWAVTLHEAQFLDHLAAQDSVLALEAALPDCDPQAVQKARELCFALTTREGGGRQERHVAFLHQIDAFARPAHVPENVLSSGLSEKIYAAVGCATGSSEKSEEAAPPGASRGPPPEREAYVPARDEPFDWAAFGLRKPAYVPGGAWPSEVKEPVGGVDL